MKAIIRFLFKSYFDSAFKEGLEIGYWEGVYKERNRLAMLWPKLKG